MNETYIQPTRRKYNQWVANETLEDYALRYTAKKARKWSVARIANTALGIVSFLALEAIGGAITLNYGFINAFWAILVVGGLIFLSGIPLSYYAARYAVDIDLLTRGAGFGYIGSTISSLVYASFTFIFFAIEAAIMSAAIQMTTGIPLSLAYIISTLLVIPLVTHGISRISIFQAWTQPIWLILQLLPLFFIMKSNHDIFPQWISFEGHQQSAAGFNLLLFGAASAVIFPLIAQNGEQADFIRFLPDKNNNNRFKWWLAVIGAGSGWVIIGVLKLLLGSFLTVLALQHGLSADLADDPSHMYSVAFGYITNNPTLAIWITGIFVVISQLKINVTNAYAGSIAWGNFFSRLTHNHPGRVVWLVFNVSIALLLMELGLYQVFDSILIGYSSLVVAWIGSVVADLVINKPLGLSPPHIEFRRGHLCDINPVGVASMIIASVVGIVANIGLFGLIAKALAAFIALFLPFILVPLFGWLSQGQYYLGRASQYKDKTIDNPQAVCELCNNEFDREDMSYCPAYQVSICSLCCALDSRCGDKCRPKAHFVAQIKQWFEPLFPAFIWHYLQSVTIQFIAVFSLTSIIIAILLSLVYYSQQNLSVAQLDYISSVLWQVFFLLLLVTGILVWLYVLAQNSSRQALLETRLQSELLMKEANAHKITAIELERARNVANTANQAKSRYLSSVSHELRTPLNTIFGYAQVMESNTTLDQKNREIASIIRRSGEHLSDVLEGILEISTIESRRLDLQKNSVSLRALVAELEAMFKPMADAKNLQFLIHCEPAVPDYITTDEKRLRQILLNLLSNAIKFTFQGSVALNINYRNQIAYIHVIDTGIGIESKDQQRIFKAFERIKNKQTSNIVGTGLGLPISQLLIELMGGNLELKSEINQGSQFRLRLFLPQVTAPTTIVKQSDIKTYDGRVQHILVIDDEMDHQHLMQALLIPSGFAVSTESSAIKALQRQDLNTFDIILLDISMPEMDGWQFLKKLRKKNNKQPVIIVSADPYEMIQKDSHYLFNAYLTKPIRRDKLLEQLQHVLQLHWHESSSLFPPQSVKINNTKSLPTESLKAIKKQAEIGYLAGVNQLLEALQAEYAKTEQWQQLQTLVKNCNMPEISQQITNWLAH